MCVFSEGVVKCEHCQHQGHGQFNSVEACNPVSILIAFEICEMFLMLTSMQVPVNVFCLGWFKRFTDYKYVSADLKACLADSLCKLAGQKLARRP